MNIARTYGDLVRKNMETHPDRAAWLIRKGLHLEAFRCKHLADKRMPQAYRYLNYQGIHLVAEALDHPENYAWTNIFAPVELLQSFGLTCVCMECLSSYLSGFYLEDALIDYAESEGLASTMCSYHKSFIGAVDAGLIPRASCAVTTSMICDGNVQTFRHLEERHAVPAFVLDIPHTYSAEAEAYVVDQLTELIAFLEKKTGSAFDMEELQRTLERENESKAHFLSFLQKRMTRRYPNTLTLVVFQLFATHLDIGMPWVLDFFRQLDQEIDRYPLSDEKRLLWLHLEPFDQKTLRSYLNYGDKVTLAYDDFDLDYTEPLDAAHPLQSLARKMILNIYNGDFRRKVEAIEGFVNTYRPDGVVQFCHWGCRQSSGGVMLLKDKMKELDVPMLVLDGDAIDRRNCPDGQIRTRFEAFLEVLRKDGE